MEFIAHIEVAAADDADSEVEAKRIERSIISALNRKFEEVEVNVEVDA